MQCATHTYMAINFEAIPAMTRMRRKQQSLLYSSTRLASQVVSVHSHVPLRHRALSHKRTHFGVRGQHECTLVFPIRSGPGDSGDVGNS